MKNLLSNSCKISHSFENVMYRAYDLALFKKKNPVWPASLNTIFFSNFASWYPIDLLLSPLFHVNDN